MSDTTILVARLAAGALAVWVLVLGGRMVMTRLRQVSPGPATQDLGSEPPAVVSLLTHDWVVTMDAVAAVVLDLAARRYYELRQPANDPNQTTIHFLATAPVPNGLVGCDRIVYDRVRSMAGTAGVVPLTALAFRDKTAAKRWFATVKKAIVVDARGRGLSRPRLGTVVIDVLVILSLAVGVLVGIMLATARTTSDARMAITNAGSGAVVGFLGGGLVFFVLLGAVAVSVGRSGDTATAAGRAAAARWLGVRAQLTATEAFADLPPASVAVWGRYLSYGAAVGATRAASTVSNLGMGDQHRVWSSYGGYWHQVRIRYQRVAPGLGMHPYQVLVAAFLTFGIGYRFLFPSGAGGERRLVSQAIGLFLLAATAVMLLGALADLTGSKTVTGRVLWVSAAGPVAAVGDGVKNDASKLYVAIDEGARDQTWAWIYPLSWRKSVNRLQVPPEVGTTVKIRARRWSRRILSVTVVHPGSAGRSNAT